MTIGLLQISMFFFPFGFFIIIFLLVIFCLKRLDEGIGKRGLGVRFEKKC